VVNKNKKEEGDRSQTLSLQHNAYNRLQPTDRFGDDVPKKPKNTI
jgi:hypothetical protein